LKITSQEEYGVRCLLQLGRQGDEKSLTIPEISRAEGISSHYVAKLMRVLRKGGLVKSVRGQAGGYVLTRPLNRITVAEALAVLGGRLYDPEFCEQHGGAHPSCTHTIDCSIRSLWYRVQYMVDQVLARTTLEELLPKKDDLAPPPAAPVQLTRLSVS
jgi:Rrf2 family protein